MLETFTFAPPPGGAPFAERRAQVRRFLEGELAAGRFDPGRSSWMSFDAAFSRRCGEQGLIGITWPRQYGGREASALERHVIAEELVAAGAPLSAHWIADRQSGPQILRHGSDALRADILPRIAAGTCYFGIGMSEPGAGSDLAGVQTRAVKVEGGWRVNGRKIWTTNAQHVHYLIALVRTAPPADRNRHVGLTQLVVDMRLPGIGVRPIRDLTGVEGFNEITFDDVVVPDTHLLGEPGAGWKLVTGELAFERSGPDRFLSNAPLLMMGIDRLDQAASPTAAAEIGGLIAQMTALRMMSLSVAGRLQQGQSPAVEAALVKDVGTRFEQQIPEVLRRLFPQDGAEDAAGEAFAQALGYNILAQTCNTLRGGTTEVLRGVIARELGLR